MKQTTFGKLILFGIRMGILFGICVMCSCGGSQTSSPTQETTVSPSASSSNDAATDATETRRSNDENDTSVNTYPEITLSRAVSGFKKVTAKFEFEGQSLSVTARVPNALLEGARHANKYAVAKGGASDADWRERFNMAFIADPAQKDFLDELHQAFIDLAKTLKLDDDRTVELFTAFVQHIRYDERENIDARFPVETFADREGDCDDKSRLLVSMLSRSGFQVATLNFNDENHMAVGIKSNAMNYKGTGYTYIETTSPSLIGFPFSDRANVQLHTVPVVQRVGNGKKKYMAAGDVEFLVNKKKELEKEITRAQNDIDKVNDQVTAAAQKVQKSEAEVSDAQSAGEHNRAVEKYNKAVDAYNALVSRQKAAAQKVNQKIEIRNYIATHADDRYNTYVWVKKQLGKK